MKTKLLLLNIVIVLALAVALLRGQGAGSLSPPGEPADGVYHTLEEVYTAASDPRTPIDSLPFTITSPGSYYLRSNLHFSDPTGHAITINSSYVNLDLNGFGLSSDPAVTGKAIDLAENMGYVTIRNGFIHGTTVVPATSSDPVTPGGFGYGIAVSSPGVDHGCRFEGLLIKGCRTNGLYLGFGSQVERCTIRQCGAAGIWSRGVVRFTSSNQNGEDGILGTSVTTCEANWNRGIGIGAPGFNAAEPAKLAAYCVANGNGDHGILGRAIINCVAKHNSGLFDVAHGLNGPGAGVVSGSFAHSIRHGGTRTGNDPAP